MNMGQKQQLRKVIRLITEKIDYYEKDIKKETPLMAKNPIAAKAMKYEEERILTFLRTCHSELTDLMLM